MANYARILELGKSRYEGYMIDNHRVMSGMVKVGRYLLSLPEKKPMTII